jgi:O-antigen/teichoic acid export membrane protein
MEEEPAGGLRAAILKGAAWSIVLRWSVRLLGLVSTFILARILEPADFGLVAMAMLIVGFVDAWLSFGLDTALIQNQSATREHYDTAWTLRLMQSAVLAVGIAAAAPLAAAAFNEPRVATVLWVICPALLLGGLSNIGVIAFRKELEFHREFKLQIISKLVGFVVTLSAAAWLRNYWALVIGIITAQGMGCALSYLMHPFRPRFSLARIRELWSFSQWMLIASIGHFFETKADEILVARLGSTRELGLYSVAAELGNMPGSEIAAPLNQALMPGFSKLQHSPPGLATAYLNVLGSVSALTFPAGIGLAMVAHEAVLVFLGSQWLDAIPLLSVLAVFGGIRASNSLAGSLMLGSGRVATAAAFGWMNTALLLAIALPLVGTHGAQGIAWAKLAGAMILAIVIFAAVMRVTGISVKQIVARLWRTLVASALMAVAVSLLPALSGGVLVALIVKVLVGVGSYAAALILLWRLAGCPDGAERFFLSQLRRRYSR